MRRVVRAAFWFEVLTTGASGLQAVFAPASFLVGMGFVGSAAALAQMLGAMWVVAAALEAGMLWRGTAALWRLYVIPVLIGDVLHTGVVLATAPGRGWPLPDLATVGLMVIYVPLRGMVLARPERVAADGQVA